MKSYLVKTVFELDAASPEEAAREVRGEMMRRDTEVIFNVHELDENGDQDHDEEPTPVILSGKFDH